MTRLAALALLLLLAVAGCGLQDPYTTPAPARPRSHAAVASTEGPGTPTAPVAGRAAPLASARTFMRGYLPYLYGLGPARAIVAVTPQLKHALGTQPMTREDGASPSHPRLDALRILAARGTRARARAIVSDESGVYFALELELVLVRGAGDWRVAALKTIGG